MKFTLKFDCFNAFLIKIIRRQCTKTTRMINHNVQEDNKYYMGTYLNLAGKKNWFLLVCTTDGNDNL